MDKSDSSDKLMMVDNDEDSGESCSPESKPKNQGKKRKRTSSDSSTDMEDILPDNTLEMEKNLHASAVKNNLDDISVRKILKKVVTNDHVLALVKLREEEEAKEDSSNKSELRPKLTRSKAKELMKVSPQSAWNLELVPIKHIPVKTTPEVTSLIAQDLPEDEDDDEYQPTHDDLPSDDDQAMESCSDLESQPRTPATPKSNLKTSPVKDVVKDGPFKVPPEINSSARKKLDLEEEATIALRTRSKLSLSSTSIEHIESTFVPPDDLPLPAVDEIWSQFLTDCLDPAQNTRHEDDDEADPEYNVAADPDAHDEEEDILNCNMNKVSRKELNDLVTELFNIMPDLDIDENLANSVLADNSRAEESVHWEGKQEPLSDEEQRPKVADRIKYEKRDSISGVSIGKSKIENEQASLEKCDVTVNKSAKEMDDKELKVVKQDTRTEKEMQSKPKVFSSVDICIQEERPQPHEGPSAEEAAPALRRATAPPTPLQVHIPLGDEPCILPEQIQILQQQLRQHIQLATSSFLQINIHPLHWRLAHNFKEYLEVLTDLHKSNPNSVVNVCNLKPAMDLVLCWEKTTAEDKPENVEMVKFMENEVERCRRRTAGCNVFVGNFHETFMKVVANSPVFLYPHLLPSMPFKADNTRRFTYLQSEDELIALGLDEFWQYVESNPALFAPRHAHPRRRWGLAAAAQLLAKHLLPWLTGKLLLSHVHNRRKGPDVHNPIYKFFANREVTPVQHRLLPFNPKLTLYEQPEYEMPRIWVRYLAKTSERFKVFKNRRKKIVCKQPAGVPIAIGTVAIAPKKAPLPIHFTKEIVSHRANLLPNIVPVVQPQEKYDIQIQPLNQQIFIQNEKPVASNIFQVVNTSSGRFYMPVTVLQRSTLNFGSPIVTPIEIKTPEVVPTVQNVPEKVQAKTDIQETKEHCKCCILLRRLCKLKQTVITDYFRAKKQVDKKCPCSQVRNPRLSRKLRLLLHYYKSKSLSVLQEIESRLSDINEGTNRLNEETRTDCSLDELAYVTSYQLKLTARLNVARNTYIKKKVQNLLSSFKIDFDDPISLTKELDKAFEVELVDMYKEFLGFLTARQADQLNVYKDYFTRACVTDLLRKVDEHVKDKTTKANILDQLNKVFMNNFATACEICSGLLETMHGYPQLAEYVFSLFPHRVETRCKEINLSSEPTPKLYEEVTEDQLADESLTHAEEAQLVMDYEADESSDENESDAGSVQSVIERDETSVIPQQVNNMPTPERNPIDTTEVTINKIDDIQDNDSSDVSMTIVSEDEEIKAETVEWSRDEDKLILEMLKEHLSPKERNDKTILEIIEEKQIIELVSNNLSLKSINDVKVRVLYLLELLLLSEIV